MNLLNECPEISDWKDRYEVELTRLQIEGLRLAIGRTEGRAVDQYRKLREQITP